MLRRGLAISAVLLTGILAGHGISVAAGTADGARGSSKVASWSLQANWGINRHAKIDDWAKTIAKVNPDVLGVQEVCNWQLAELADELKREHGLRYHVKAGPVHEKKTVNDCGSGVKYGQGMLSKKPMSKHDVIKYKAHGDENRGYMVVRTEVAGKPTWVFNTHTDYAPADVLRAQLKALFKHAGKASRAIVLGDLNTTPDNKKLRAYKKDAGFHDAAPNCDSKPTDTSKCKPTHEGGKRIDFVLVKGFTPPGTGRMASDASDHHLLGANLS